MCVLVRARVNPGEGSADFVFSTSVTSFSAEQLPRFAFSPLVHLPRLVCPFLPFVLFFLSSFVSSDYSRGSARGIIKSQFVLAHRFANPCATSGKKNKRGHIIQNARCLESCSQGNIILPYQRASAIHHSVGVHQRAATHWVINRIRWALPRPTGCPLVPQFCLSGTPWRVLRYSSTLSRTLGNSAL